MRRALPCAAAATLAASGCAGVTPGPRADIRATVQTFLRQCALGHGDRVLDLLSSPGRQAFIDGRGTLGGCAQILRLRPPPGAGDYAAATFALRSYNGAQAGAFVSIAGRRAAVELTQGGALWLISGPQ